MVKYIDVYLDITCRGCGFSRSTDYDKGFVDAGVYNNYHTPCGFPKNAREFKAIVSKEGWEEGPEGALCPSCTEKRKRNEVRT